MRMGQVGRELHRRRRQTDRSHRVVRGDLRIGGATEADREGIQMGDSELGIERDQVSLGRLCHFGIGLETGLLPAAPGGQEILVRCAGEGQRDEGTRRLGPLGLCRLGSRSRNLSQGGRGKHDAQDCDRPPGVSEWDRQGWDDDRRGVRYDSIRDTTAARLVVGGEQRMKDDAGTALKRLVGIMARLRAEGGCPWDREQDLASLRPYLIEEAYEGLEEMDLVVEGGRWTPLCEELGDLLFQIVFHAQLASEKGEFDMADVCRAIADKLESRHPHVFGDSKVGTTSEVLANWAPLKAEDKRRQTALEGSPLDGL